MRVIILPKAEKFLLALEKSNPVAAKQVAVRIKKLADNPRPPDAEKMRGVAAEYLRVHAGRKHRIIYLAREDLIIASVGYRNDDKAYREFMRTAKIK